MLLWRNSNAHYIGVASCRRGRARAFLRALLEHWRWRRPYPDLSSSRPSRYTRAQPHLPSPASQPHRLPPNLLACDDQPKLEAKVGAKANHILNPPSPSPYLYPYPYPYPYPYLYPFPYPYTPTPNPNPNPNPVPNPNSTPGLTLTPTLTPNPNPKLNPDP